ncbi:DUF4974 domain-containing protein [Kaistella flava (ex Peng et al. 2021)]|uniref:DUF4974 domain-containing protein n=1 Tax=Kaistella flava (ex Peng et al. 2021) TaxID=2038776 RepID=A0A7M2Y3Q7_9FLAO|nr:FecR domain-containing protein [Kaistella flava (ex Peng et al. 2021)]QOW08857.1 DUF4974 domain-containing protein [Kaistella flava (ex Peng et al. 2021)]
MNQNPEIFKIITDYFSNEISESDRQILDEWLKTPENKKVFKEYAKVNYLYTAEPNYKILKLPARSNVFARKMMRYAAVFLLIAAVGIYWKVNTNNASSPSPEFISVAINGVYQNFENTTENNILIDKNKVQLASLENGTLRLTENKSKSNLIIHVPNGKNLKVILSDGSEVLLNAGTQISLQSDFIKSDSRKVTLVGEAFFEVAKDPAHPFYVMTDQFTTKVLGTKFNISSYKNQRETFVNLVEGRIEVNGKKIATKKILAPGQKISFNPSDKMSAVELAKPQQDMDWLNKEISFENSSTDEVLNKIERVYGLQIIRNRVEVENFHFSGTFKIENLDQIINSLEILLNCKIQKDGSKLILISKN